MHGVWFLKFWFAFRGWEKLATSCPAHSAARELAMNDYEDKSYVLYVC